MFQTVSNSYNIAIQCMIDETMNVIHLMTWALHYGISHHPYVTTRVYQLLSNEIYRRYGRVTPFAPLQTRTCDDDLDELCLRVIHRMVDEATNIHTLRSWTTEYNLDSDTYVTNRVFQLKEKETLTVTTSRKRQLTSHKDASISKYKRTDDDGYSETGQLCLAVSDFNSESENLAEESKNHAHDLSQNAFTCENVSNNEHIDIDMVSNNNYIKHYPCR